MKNAGANKSDTFCYIKGWQFLQIYILVIETGVGRFRAMVCTQWLYTDILVLTQGNTTASLTEAITFEANIVT